MSYCISFSIRVIAQVILKKLPPPYLLPYSYQTGFFAYQTEMLLANTLFSFTLLQIIINL